VPSSVTAWHAFFLRGFRRRRRLIFFRKKSGGYTRLEVFYTTTTGNTQSTRCRGWDDDEALQQLQLMLADFALDGSQVLAVLRVDEPEQKPWLAQFRLQ